MTAVPLLPSLVAVMVAVPPDWPMTRPPPLTEATDVLLLAQVMTRPVSVPPTESLVTAASSWVAPTRIVADAGFTVTVATGTLMTAMVALPVLPSLMAVTVADPAALPVTRPLVLTVATVVLLLDHAMTRPVRVPPAESRVAAESCCVAPTARLADAGLTVTVATGTVVTVMAALPVLPSLVAVTVADPAATAVTRPLALTAATAGALLAQVTMRPLRGAPLESWGAAASCKVAPSRRLATVGVTTTAATGVGTTVTVLVSAIPPAGVVATTM